MFLCLSEELYILSAFFVRHVIVWAPYIYLQNKLWQNYDFFLKKKSFNELWLTSDEEVVFFYGGLVIFVVVENDVVF